MITLVKNGFRKEVATGYSWKCLIFGSFYAASRGDMKGFVIQSALAVITGGIAWLFIPFTYNKIYLERCINNGWMLDSK